VSKTKHSLTKQHLLDFINGQANFIARRDLARAFNIKGQERILLKTLLHELWKEGSIIKKGKAYSSSVQDTSDYCIVELLKRNEDGEFIARAVDNPKVPDSVKITIKDSPSKHKRAYSQKLSLGDRLLVKLNPISVHHFHAQVLRKIETKEKPLIGIFYSTPPSGGIVAPTHRADRNKYVIDPPYTLHAHEEDLVEIELLPSTSQTISKARVVKIIGSMKKPKSFSLIALHTHEIPYEFKEDSLEIARKAEIPLLEGREDLRNIPLVTIDDEDARDFDDAVWAAPDQDPKNPNGWHIVVAIADVSYYVTPSDSLDKEAYERGNSVYFPDLVVPMLPEELSNGLCSLKPQEDRACLAAHLWIDSKGKLIRHKFSRALMRSYARLTYNQVQKLYEDKGESSASLRETIVLPLYKAYECLEKARLHRGPLELEIPEKQVILNKLGTIETIRLRPRLTSHKLIEEYMILANVAAAMALEQKGILCMYRVHAAPTPEKMDSLREYLKGTMFSLPKGQTIQPKSFNFLIEKASKTSFASTVQELVLRSQAQAVYSPDNIGHFGLNLRTYCHFTSPIRRYADILVHRALVKSLKLDQETEFSYAHSQFEQIATHISLTERRASSAEWETVDRYVTAFLSQKVGEEFAGVINGVTRFALFVKLEESGADALLPLRSLANDYYIFEEAKHRVIGRRTKKIFSLGDKVKVILDEANPLTGQLIVSLKVEKGEKVYEKRKEKKRPQKTRKKSRNRRSS
jgi:ribonuclease R